MEFEGIQTRPRYGHIVAVFGLFMATTCLMFQGINTSHTIAFGTSEIAEMSNQYRISSSLASLTTNQTLANSAQSKADDMAAKAYFAHNSPDGTTPWSFFAAQKYDYSSAGENLALTNESATSVVDGWYTSPGHRANMLSTEYTDVGYGVAFVPSFAYNGITYKDVYLVVAHYAKPLEARLASSKPEEPTKKSEITTLGQRIGQPTNTNISGPYVSTKKQSVKLPSSMVYATLGLSAVLISVGIFAEIKRIRKHLLLSPTSLRTR